LLIDNVSYCHILNIKYIKLHKDQTMFKKTLIAISLLTVLGGCQSTPAEPKNEIDEMVCYYPDAPQKIAPKWVCGITPSSLEISATGYAKKNVAGLSVMNDIALTDARVNLGTQFQVSVQSIVKTALTSETKTTSAQGSAGTEDKSLEEKTSVGAEQQQVNENVTEYFEKITKNISSTVLTNSRVIVKKSSPSGGLYTLVGMDKVTYDANFNKIVQKASSKDAELWGKFNDKKTSDQLEKVLSRLADK
jgi:hypothetical protein